MRIFYFLLLLSYCFISCEVYQNGQYFTAKQSSLSAITLKPHHNPVDVFFEAERPSKPFYKVKLVEVQGRPELSADQMLAKLKEVAQSEGVDALVISDVGKQANLITTLPADNGVYAYQKIVGLGLKYKERIDYMNELLKEQEIHYWPDSIPEPKIFQMSYDMNGKNISLKDTFISKFFYHEIYLFEDQFSVYAPADDWGFLMDTINNVFLKKYPFVYENMKASFPVKNFQVVKPVFKLRNAATNEFVTYEMERVYDAAGFLISRRFHKRRSQKYLWEDEISYNRDGLPDKIVRYKLDNGKKKTYFEMQNKYYAVDDLPLTDN